MWEHFALRKKAVWQLRKPKRCRHRSARPRKGNRIPSIHWLQCKCDGERSTIDAVRDIRLAAPHAQQYQEESAHAERARETTLRRRRSNRTVGPLPSRLIVIHGARRRKTYGGAGGCSPCICYCLVSKPFAKMTSSGSPATSTWIVSSQYPLNPKDVSAATRQRSSTSCPSAAAGRSTTTGS